MEGPTKQFIEETQKANDYIIRLKLLKDEIKYLDVNANSFEGQSVPIGELVNKMELIVQETLKEGKGLLEGAEVKNQDKDFKSINRLFHCPECSYTSKWGRRHLQYHINAVHLKLKSFKCSFCAKGKLIGHFIISS